MISTLLTFLVVAQGSKELKPIAVLEQTMSARGASLMVASTQASGGGCGLYFVDSDGVRKITELSDLELKTSGSDFRPKTTFFVDGDLLLRGIPGPVLSSRRLVLVSRVGKERTLHSLRDLHGHVKIHSAKEALNFVRLRGSPALTGVLRDYGAECGVLDRARVDDSVVFGATDVLARLSAMTPGMLVMAMRRC